MQPLKRRVNLTPQLRLLRSKGLVHKSTSRISPWGAYGIAAQLAYELKTPDYFQTEEMEDFMRRQCVAAGGTDGAYAAQVLCVDGTSSRTQRALVAMLREIIAHGLKTV